MSCCQEKNDIRNKQTTKLSFQENAFQDVVCEMVAFLLRPQCVNGSSRPVVLYSCQQTGPQYRKTSNISRTLVGNKIVDNSDVVGASPVGAAPTTSSFST